MTHTEFFPFFSVLWQTIVGAVNEDKLVNSHSFLPSTTSLVLSSTAGGRSLSSFPSPSSSSVSHRAEKNNLPNPFLVLLWKIQIDFMGCRSGSVSIHEPNVPAIRLQQFQPFDLISCARFTPWFLFLPSDLPAPTLAGLLSINSIPKFWFFTVSCIGLFIAFSVAVGLGCSH